MRVATGSFAGNSTDNRDITGVGFQPDLVIVKRADGGGWVGAFRTSEMTGDQCLDFSNNGFYTNVIQSFGADGFQVGSGDISNKTGDTTYWLAVKDDGAGDFKVGKYAGDGLDTKAITGVGFQPDVVFVKGDCVVQAANPVIRYSTLTSQQTFDCASGELYTLDRVESIDADGFTVGNSWATSVNGQNHYWFAFKATTAGCVVNTYTGNAADDRSITTPNFLPIFAFIGNSSTTTPMIWRFGSTGDLSGSTSADWTTDLIQAFNATGFQVGTATGVNGNGHTLHYMAIKDVNVGNFFKLL